MKGKETQESNINSHKKSTKLQYTLLWLMAGLLSVALTVLMFFPATWLAAVVEKQSQGRITLGDAQGSLWQGSAFIGGAASGSEAVAPLLPGRFTWKLSPAVLVAKVDLWLDNPDALSAPVHLSGSWSQWKISASSIKMPAGRLAALGAPLNTLQPSGDMRLGWNDLQLILENKRLNIAGLITLDLMAMSSRLSPVKPLGSYQMTMAFDAQQAMQQQAMQQQATINLKTVSGALELGGSGKLVNGRLQFSGTAQAADGQEEKLENLLNLLGQRRQQNGKTVIGLEFS